MQRLKPKPVVVLAAILVVAVFSGTAAAVLTSDSGGSQVRVDKRTENVATTTSSTAFIDIPGTEITVSLNASRLIDASFTAESQCSGPAATVCSIRIVATNVATGATTELNPVAGLDFAFDSAPASQDYREAHAMDRSRRLPAGTYRIRAQRAVSNAGTVFVLDDWHFAVYQNV